MSAQDSGNSNAPAEQDTPTRLLKDGSVSNDGSVPSGGSIDSTSNDSASPMSRETDEAQSQSNSHEGSRGSDTPIPTIEPDTPLEGKRRKERSPSATGRTINMWQLAEKLGEGGMGSVYRAKHQLLERTVAIKLLHPNLLHEGKSRLRFQEEAMAVGALNHKNIVGVSDCGVTEEGEPFLIMELLSGKSLSSLIKSSKALSMKQAVPIFIQICQGLEHAHRHGTIHRDLKPSNIIVTDSQNAVVKIVDFGIAKRLSTVNDEQLQRLTSTGELVGSPIYMSPEQSRGTAPDARSDIYSLGILMYEALTGAPPFTGNTFFETLAMHLDAPVPKFAGKGTSSDLAAMEPIVLRCLAKFPGDRYQTVEEVHDDIQKHFKHLIPQETHINLPFGLTVKKLSVLASITLFLVLASTVASVLYVRTASLNELPDSNSFVPFDLWPIYKRLNAKDYQQLIRNNNVSNALPRRAYVPEDVKLELLATSIRNQGLIKLNAHHFYEGKADLEKALGIRKNDLQASESDLQCVELKADIAKACEGIGNLNDAYRLHRESFEFIADAKPTDANSWAQGGLSYARVCIKRATLTPVVDKTLLNEGRNAYLKLIEALPNQRILRDVSGSDDTSGAIRRDKFLAQARCLLADTYRVYERSDKESREFGEYFFPLRDKIKAARAEKDPHSELFKLKEQMRLLKRNGMDPAPFMIPRDLYNSVIDATMAQIKSKVADTGVDDYETSAVADKETSNLILARAHWSRGLLYRKNGNDAVTREELRMAVEEARTALETSKYREVPLQLLILALRDFSGVLWATNPFEAAQMRVEAANLLAESKSSEGQ